MSTKHLSATFFYFTGIATLSAQAPTTALRQAGFNDSALTQLIHQIEQNAVMALLGLTLLTGVLCFACMCKSCGDLGKKKNNTRISSMSVLLIAALGLGISGTGCTAAQKAQAANIRAAQVAEGRYCVCHAPQHNGFYNGVAGINNQYSCQNQSASQGKPFCKYCGQRVYNGHR